MHHVDTATTGFLADAGNDLVERRGLPVLDVHADLHAPGERQRQPERPNPRESAAGLPDDARDRSCDLDVLGSEVDVEGDQRPPRAHEHAARGRIERTRPEIRSKLALPEAAPELVRAAATEEGRSPAAAHLAVEEDGQPQFVADPLGQHQGRIRSSPEVVPRDRDDRDDVDRADSRMHTGMPAEVDELARAADPGEQPLDQRLLRADEREDRPVVIGIGMHVEQPGGASERLADRGDDGRVPPFRDVRDGLERQLHPASLGVAPSIGCVPGRRRTYRSLASLQRDNRGCRACLEAGYPLESKPVFEGMAGQAVYLFGQAPGPVEGVEGRPWRGRAGATLRRWLELDEPAFYATFYCASVTRCDPGRASSGRGDRTPTPTEQRLCEFWRDHELALLRPQLVVTVGGLALRRLLGLTNLTDAVGRRFALGEVPVVPLPHPSGASGWLNDAANRRSLDAALAVLKREVAFVSETTSRAIAP